MVSHKMFGCKKSFPDERDILVTSFFEKLAIPDYYDISDMMTPIRNQGHEGSCVGFALACGTKEYQEQKDYSRFIPLSPRYIYEKAKQISGHSEGTTLRAAIEVVFKEGVCLESYWPYRVNQPGKPRNGADEIAGKYKIKSYARVHNLDQLKQSIYEFGATIIGVKVYKGMMSEKCEATGVVPDPTCWDRKPLGGHAICAVGYADKSPYFKDGHIKCKNSWGDHGDDGYLYLSYKNIKKNMLDSFSCVDVEADEIYRLGFDKDWHE